jgi:hypothetical protein
MVMVPGAGVPEGPPRVKLPAVKAEPLVKVMVPVLPALPLLPINTAPDTVSEGLPEAANVSVPELVVVAVDPSCRLAQTAPLTSTVTVSARSMVTASAALGTGAPTAPPEVRDQVAVEFQVPVVTAEKRAPVTLNALVVTEARPEELAVKV